MPFKTLISVQHTGTYKLDDILDMKGNFLCYSGPELETAKSYA